MTTIANKVELSARLESLGQQHLLAFWDELGDSGRAQLAAQIQSIDFAQIAELSRGNRQQLDWAALARRSEPPLAIRVSDRLRQDHPIPVVECTPAQARQRGIQVLSEGKVGVLVTAGGQGSRLGFDQPKGLYPIGPVSGASLLQIHLEKAQALARRYGKAVPVYLMNSPATVEEQSAYLRENNRFGLPAEDLFSFCQATMPAVDAKTGKLLLSCKDCLFSSPDGHGGTVAALATSGALADMHRRGIEQLFYFQVDNPLGPMGDPEFIGYHLLAESEVTSMAIAKHDPVDKLGNFVSLDGCVQVIEYSDFPEDVAALRDPQGELRFWAGSIAIHMFGVTFLERSLQLRDALPFHIAHKKVSHVDETGRLVTPPEPNALKFERFIFDLLPHARNAIVVEYAEEECFAPLKNAPGAPKDTAEYVQRLMINEHRRWLESAGVNVAPRAMVEISPLWALDAEGVARRMEPGMFIDEATYLCES